MFLQGVVAGFRGYKDLQRLQSMRHNTGKTAGQRQASSERKKVEAMAMARDSDTSFLHNPMGELDNTQHTVALPGLSEEGRECDCTDIYRPGRANPF
jgi:hypothetical protein